MLQWVFSLLMFSLSLVSSSWAADSEVTHSPETKTHSPTLQDDAKKSVSADREYVQITRAKIPSSDKAYNFGVLYLGQWASYFITQSSTIREHGSFRNWRTNIVRPHFDQDGINFNLINHSYAGNIYYNFYRSRGYEKKNAVFWSIVSGAAFEFTIESITERPSIQDLYQTPILGSLLGMGFEATSLYFHSLDVWPARVLGYIFNPFTLLPSSYYRFRSQPIIKKDAYGMAFGVEF
ncbi:MAG: DUF3943 domain-containing protein [Proteobacteria bacterium]|nr:MAG: DUF3943 domain-containing protein [Pseudomonadota bacterium]